MAQIGVYEKDYNGLNTPLLLNFVKKNPVQFFLPPMEMQQGMGILGQILFSSIFP